MSSKTSQTSKSDKSAQPSGRSAKASKSPAKVAAAAALASGSRWWWYPTGLLLGLFVTFQIYGPSISGPFLFDDRYLPFFLPDFAQAPLRFWLMSVRPLLMASYWINYQVSRTDPYSYHLVNVFLHFSHALLVWLMFRKRLEWARVESWTRAILSTFGGELFLVHPIQTESVTYVASRSESQSMFFFSAAFVTFLYRRQVAASFKITVAVLALFGAAVLSKEHTAVLPALLLLTDYFWNPGFSFRGIKNNWKLYVPIAAGGAFAIRFVWRVLGGARTAGFGMKDLNWHDYFFTQCRAIWVYLRMFVAPYGLNVDHEFAISRSVLDQGAIIGLLALVAVGMLAWVKRREYPLASYGYFAFLLLMAPTSSVVPIRDPLVEHRLYPAVFALILICCEFLRRWRVSRPALAATLGATLCVYSIAAYGRNEVWSNAISLWQDTARKSPHKSRPLFQLAYAYYSEGHCGAAVEQYQKAAQAEKPDHGLYMDWGLAYECAQQPQAALEKFQQAIQLEKTAHAFTQIAMVHANRGEMAPALDALAEAEKIDAGFEMTYLYRGNIYLLGADFDRAAEQFRRALSIKPADLDAQKGLDMAQRRVVPKLQ